MSTEYLARFVREARELSDSIGDALDSGDLDEIFRIVHSIKSMAGQAGLEDMAISAHELEERLEGSRSANENLDGALRRTVASWTAALQEDLSELDREMEEALRPPAPNPSFNRFERQLLSEARLRGERSYRLVCTIDPESPLKIARAHLVVNNLELCANVIKTVPALTDPDDTRFHEITVYLTADVEEWELYEAAHVDEIERIRIEEIDIEGVVVSRGQIADTAEGTVGVSGPYHLDARTLEWLVAQIGEADLALRRIPRSAGKQVQRLRTVVGGIGEALRSVQRQSLVTLLERLESQAAELSARIGKRVSINTTGGRFLVDTRILDLIYEPLLHIIRNAVDHGIESPETRTRAGKAEVGVIELSGEEHGALIVVRVSDDGRGVDWDAVRSSAEEQGIAVGDRSLADVLMTPGFSTVDTANGVSGRGYGLDIVHQRITAMGGDFEILETDGGGTTCVVSVPTAVSSGAQTVLRDRSQLYAIPSSSIERIVPLDLSTLKRDRGGGVWFERTPLYSVRGRLSVGEGVPREGTLVLIRYLDRAGWLCVDDVLFERHGGPSEADPSVEPLNPSLLQMTSWKQDDAPAGR